MSQQQAVIVKRKRDQYLSGNENRFTANRYCRKSGQKW